MFAFLLLSTAGSNPATESRQKPIHGETVATENGGEFGCIYRSCRSFYKVKTLHPRLRRGLLPYAAAAAKAYKRQKIEKKARKNFRAF
ncbi:MAG TPA: hypothetical protein VK742_01365 [Candidatus Sulfotelmatobacter sp.]|jgi:hypothetical protein|nr:hypothetical protein [Candidatus Sulfotelmatobacter sp.]